MSSTYDDWRQYQDAVARAFRELGCSAEVEKTVAGARGTHKVDVYATFHQLGDECRCLVECKLTARPVTKADVLTFREIVQDIGADLGFMFSENGFQSGAHAATRNTNIRLCSSLEDFRRTALFGRSRIALVAEQSAEPDAPPVHVFPDRCQPYHLVEYGERLYISNWKAPQGGNVAIVDPMSRAIESIIDLDKYEYLRPRDGGRVITQHPPGNIACANGKLFVGQIFSEFVLVIDIETQSIVKRIPIPGGGEGAIAVSPDGRHVYFASNRVSSLFIIDSATYEYGAVEYPTGGRGCLCVLPHPSHPLLYMGIQRGGKRDGRRFTGGNCFLAVYDLSRRRYVGSVYLAEVDGNRSDDSTPICLTFDESSSRLFIGMFQSLRGICVVDELGREILDNFRFAPNSKNRYFRWVDSLSQALHRGQLLSVNRNNRELVTLDKRTGRVESSVYLGEASNGPHSVTVFGDVAIISYPGRGGLIFHDPAPSR